MKDIIELYCGNCRIKCCGACPLVGTKRQALSAASILTFKKKKMYPSLLSPSTGVKCNTRSVVLVSTTGSSPEIHRSCL